MTKFTIRPWEASEVDYEAACRLTNQDWPNQPSTVEIWKHNDGIRNPERFDRRFIGEIESENGKHIVAVGFLSDRIWAQKKGKYYLGFSIDKRYKGQGLDGPFYEHLVKALADKNPTALEIGTREDNIDRIEFLQQKGFKQTMRAPSSELDVQSFDIEPFRKYSDKVDASGISILSVQQLQVQDADWKQKLYDLEMTIEQDVPDTEEFTPAGLDEYSKNFERVNFQADAWFVAVDGDDYVGMSSLWPNKVLDDILSVGITGVLPSHRRRGIGTALKLKTIEFAKAGGGKTIDTGNEENNPMYDLNMKLGFKPTPAWLSFETIL